MPKTTTRLRNQARQLDRRQRRAKKVVEYMRAKGCALHFGGGHWFLTDGTVVTAAVAASITLHPTSSTSATRCHSLAHAHGLSD